MLRTDRHQLMHLSFHYTVYKTPLLALYLFLSVYVSVHPRSKWCHGTCLESLHPSVFTWLKWFYYSCSLTRDALVACLPFAIATNQIMRTNKLWAILLWASLFCFGSCEVALAFCLWKVESNYLCSLTVFLFSLVNYWLHFSSQDSSVQMLPVVSLALQVAKTGCRQGVFSAD